MLDPMVDIFEREGKRLEGGTCEILETQVVGESFDEVVDRIMEGERVELFTVAHMDLKARWVRGKETEPALRQRALLVRAAQGIYSQ